MLAYSDFDGCQKKSVLWLEEFSVVWLEEFSVVWLEEQRTS